MPTPTLFPLYDRAVGGRLEAILLRYKAEGLGPRPAQRRLVEEHGIDPSVRTVARWLVGKNGAPESLADEAAA